MRGARPPIACQNCYTGSVNYTPMPLQECEGDACNSRALPVGDGFLVGFWGLPLLCHRHIIFIVVIIILIVFFFLIYHYY